LSWRGGAEERVQDFTPAPGITQSNVCPGGEEQKRGCRTSHLLQALPRVMFVLEGGGGGERVQDFTPAPGITQSNVCAGGGRRREGAGHHTCSRHYPE
jgi:hypothetical protein